METSCTPIFRGSRQTAYRDPACYWDGSDFHLFMTFSRLIDGYLENRIALSHSKDLKHWSEPLPITEANLQTNYSSPGNVLPWQGGYRLFFCSYPMPQPWRERSYATEDARLYFMDSEDMIRFSRPVPLNPKGTLPIEAAGRMIDPYVFPDSSDPGLYHLFFKQNGVSHALSRDLIHWQYQEHTDAGENACVIFLGNQYHLFHSPQNGFGHKVSKDLIHWQELGIQTLGQSSWEWASGRLTAAFVMEAPAGFSCRYLLFFHGSRKEALPETHGSASIALLGTNDFITYHSV